MLFGEGSIFCHQITDDSERKECDADGDRNTRNDEGLDSFSTDACEVVEVDKSGDPSEADEKRGKAKNKKDFERFVENVDFCDIYHRFPDMFPDIAEKSGWPCGRVCFDIYPFDSETFFVNLDESVDDIRKS